MGNFINVVNILTKKWEEEGVCESIPQEEIDAINLNLSQAWKEYNLEQSRIYSKLLNNPNSGLNH